MSAPFRPTFPLSPLADWAVIRLLERAHEQRQDTPTTDPAWDRLYDVGEDCYASLMVRMGHPIYRAVTP